MQKFSTDAPNSVPKENYFLSQPHQPFFLAGIIWAVLLMLVFMFSYKLLLKGESHTFLTPSDFHAYSLIYIVFTHFFIGFLYTTFSRFCQSEPVKKPYYLRTFFLYQAATAMIVLGFFLSQTLMLWGMGLLLLGQMVFLYMIQRIFTSALAPIKDDPFWILLSLYIGTATHTFFILATLFGWQHLALPFAFNLYLVFMTFSVAQRMVPFFSHSSVPKHPRFVLLVFVGLLLKSFASIWGAPLFEAGISLLLGVYIFFEVLRWKLSFSQAPNILKILHLALYWMPIALIGGALVQFGEYFMQVSFLFAGTHLLALGFLTTIIIGFGTRVTLGHSGQPPHADKITLQIFYLTQLVVAARLLYSLVYGFDLGASWLFDLSLSLWLLLFIFWGWKFAPVLIHGKPETKA
jgi:uncharacterized protein involved in response to NO